MRRQQIQTAVILAVLATMLTVGSALAHAGHDDHSILDRILNSAWIPLLGVAALAFVSLSWWRVRGKQGE